MGAAMPLDAEQAEAVGFADFVGEEGEDLEHAAFRLLLTSFLRHTTGKCLDAIDSCLDLMLWLTRIHFRQRRCGPSRWVWRLPMI